MKPLTEEEIAELRRAMGFDDLSARYYIDACLERLLDEVTRSRALLKRIEWNGDRPPAARCPFCWRVQPGNDFADPEDERGHAPDCELAALLGAP